MFNFMGKRYFHELHSKYKLAFHRLKCQTWDPVFQEGKPFGDWVLNPGHKDENVYIFCRLWQERLGKYGISCPINPTQKGVTTATVQHIYILLFLLRIRISRSMYSFWRKRMRYCRYTILQSSSAERQVWTIEKFCEALHTEGLLDRTFCDFVVVEVAAKQSSTFNFKVFEMMVSKGIWVYISGYKDGQ